MNTFTTSRWWWKKTHPASSPVPNPSQTIKDIKSKLAVLMGLTVMSSPNGAVAMQKQIKAIYDKLSTLPGA